MNTELLGLFSGIKCVAPPDVLTKVREGSMYKLAGPFKKDYTETTGRPRIYVVATHHVSRGGKRVFRIAEDAAEN